MLDVLYKLYIITTIINLNIITHYVLLINTASVSPDHCRPVVQTRVVSCVQWDCGMYLECHLSLKKQHTYCFCNNLCYWWTNFYPNVTTLRLGLCRRNSVCRLSVVCLSVVCNVGAPYSGGWSFRQYFFIAVYTGHPLTSVQNFTEIVLGNCSVGSINRKRGIKIQQFWTYRRLYLINVTR